MLRLCATLALCLALVACSEVANGPGMISQSIGDIVRDPSAREVDLAKLTSFGWDRFVVFKPGTTREEICDFIGAGRNHCGRIVRYTVLGQIALDAALRAEVQGEAKQLLRSLATYGRELRYAYEELRRIQAARSIAEAEEKPTRLAQVATLTDRRGARTPSRNAPCPCGPGSKFKRCCGKNPPNKLDKAA